MLFNNSWPNGCSSDDDVNAKHLLFQRSSSGFCFRSVFVSEMKKMKRSARRRAKRERDVSARRDDRTTGTDLAIATGEARGGRDRARRIEIAAEVAHAIVIVAATTAAIAGTGTREETDAIVAERGSQLRVEMRCARGCTVPRFRYRIFHYMPILRFPQ